MEEELLQDMISRTPLRTQESELMKEILKNSLIYSGKAEMKESITEIS